MGDGEGREGGSTHVLPNPAPVSGHLEWQLVPDSAGPRDSGAKQHYTSLYAALSLAQPWMKAMQVYLHDDPRPVALHLSPHGGDRLETKEIVQGSIYIVCID